MEPRLRKMKQPFQKGSVLEQLLNTQTLWGFKGELTCSSARVKCGKFTVDSLALRRPMQQPAQSVTLSGVVRSKDLWCRRDMRSAITCWCWGELESWCCLISCRRRWSWMQLESGSGKPYSICKKWIADSYTLMEEWWSWSAHWAQQLKFHISARPCICNILYVPPFYA